MTELQQPTQEDTSIHTAYLVDNLEKVHQEAVYMRFGGKEYMEIAEELKVAYTTVRHWFASDGICYAAHKQLADERSRENRKKFKQLDKKIQEYAPDALE